MKSKPMYFVDRKILPKSNIEITLVLRRLAFVFAFTFVFLLENVSFWKSCGFQRVNSQQKFLKIGIIQSFFEKLQLKVVISEMLQHYSPSALSFWQPQDSGVLNQCCMGWSPCYSISRHKYAQNQGIS